VKTASQLLAYIGLTFITGMLMLADVISDAFVDSARTRSDWNWCINLAFLIWVIATWRLARKKS
jgi:hypothetical protein